VAKQRVSVNSRKSLTEVVDDIVNVLETNGEPDKTAVYACCNELLVSELTVSSACRVKNAGTDICNVYLVGCELERVHELYSCASAALYDEGDNSARTVGEVLLSKLVVFVTC